MLAVIHRILHHKSPIECLFTSDLHSDDLFQTPPLPDKIWLRHHRKLPLCLSSWLLYPIRRLHQLKHPLDSLPQQAAEWREIVRHNHKFHSDDEQLHFLQWMESETHEPSSDSVPIQSGALQERRLLCESTRSALAWSSLAPRNHRFNTSQDCHLLVLAVAQLQLVSLWWRDESGQLLG